jgi:hypothetical protein
MLADINSIRPDEAALEKIKTSCKNSCKKGDGKCAV